MLFILFVDLNFYICFHLCIDLSMFCLYSLIYFKQLIIFLSLYFGILL